MTYSDFEELPVWRAASKLYITLEAHGEHPAFRGRWYLKDQLLRAALSISNCIAEGFDSGTTRHLIAYIYRSKGSAAEVRSILCQMLEIKDFEGLWAELEKHREECRSISRQLWGWARLLQKQEQGGQRYISEEATPYPIF